MKIIEFNTDKDIFEFEVTGFKSDFHAHPIVEVLYSKSGGIELTTLNRTYQNVHFAYIAANTIHQIDIDNKTVSILMFECTREFQNRFLLKKECEMSDGIITIANPTLSHEAYHKFRNYAYDEKELKNYSPRIKICLDYLRSSHSDYHKMLDELCSKLHLSRSRVSHIFSDEMGISLKKYLVWSKLKSVFKDVVAGELNMYEAALKSGFYDQAHLSKAFKQMLGISPSEKYNSRMIQE